MGHPSIYPSGTTIFNKKKHLEVIPFLTHQEKVRY